ncbi:hypothetical protein JJ685_10175 [Ramlibacter monticola]|uniref:Uncharacterized protein n=1 Tax=Ramlibacter monticola TaxID=1926872 RepID=A0A937CTD6_9BURK|nr:hypothetical protein [Ramlibacter monticola]
MSALIPWALAQPVRNADTGAFMALSALLVGRPSLDTALAQRLHDALAAEDAGFAASAQALLAFINERKVDPRNCSGRSTTRSPPRRPCRAGS